MIDFIRLLKDNNIDYKQEVDGWKGVLMIKYLLWIIKGRKVIHYPGFHCGCCGKWNAIPFDIPEYKSSGEWWDTWGICPKNNPCKDYD